MEKVAKIPTFQDFALLHKRVMNGSSAALDMANDIHMTRVHQPFKPAYVITERGSNKRLYVTKNVAENVTACYLQLAVFVCMWQ